MLFFRSYKNQYDPNNLSYAYLSASGSGAAIEKGGR